MGYAGNTEPQFIMPSGKSMSTMEFCMFLYCMNKLFTKCKIPFLAIAIKETAKIGDKSQRRTTKGVEDLGMYLWKNGKCFNIKSTHQTAIVRINFLISKKYN